MENTPYEIERKYLIKMPDIKILRSQKNYKDEEMTQMYMSDKGKYAGMRIRKSVCEGKTTCKKTFKRDITALKRIEIEEDISEKEYGAMAEYRDKAYAPIHKHRHSFEYKGQIVEIDIYDFWTDRATAEVELKYEGQSVELPEFIEVIKEVTEDKRYRNRSLAREVIYESHEI